MHSSRMLYRPLIDRMLASASQGGSLVPGGVCLVWGVSAWSGRGLPGLGGWVSGPGGCASQHRLRQTTPVDRITDACKNITLAQLRCGR